jgi:hypothetical protein
MRIKVRVINIIHQNLTYHHGEIMNNHHGAAENTEHHHGVPQRPDQVPPDQPNQNNIHLRGLKIALEIGLKFKIVTLQTGTEKMQRNPINKPPANQKLGERVEAGQAGRKDGKIS